jgi:uncharacterized cupredoxin-like copper-binding protein
MSVRLPVLALLAAVLVLAFAPAATPQPSAAKVTTVTVTMKEFKFTFSKRTVPHGVVVFKLVNKGVLPHDLKIGGKKSALIAKGKSGTLRVTLAKGSKAYLCTVPGHAAGGMKGTLRVT